MGEVWKEILGAIHMTSLELLEWDVHKLEQKNASWIQNLLANYIQNIFQYFTFAGNYFVVLRLICLKTLVVSLLIIWMFVTEVRASAGMLKGWFQNFRGA